MPSYSSAKNLETCLSGKFPTLCKKSLLTAEQLVQVKNAEQFTNENTKGFLSGLGSNLGQVVMSVGDRDVMNLATGHYIMDMGGGDKMKLATGDYLMNMGGGDMMNLATGAMTFSFD
jgi:hypothetical protein